MYILNEISNTLNSGNLFQHHAKELILGKEGFCVRASHQLHDSLKLGKNAFC